MAVKDYKTNPDENTTISGINIAEGCPPSGINNAIRQLMADVKADKTAQDTATAARVKTVNGNTPDSDGNITPEQTGCLPLTGGTMTGNVISQNALYKVKRTDFDVTETPSASRFASSLYVVDKNDKLLAHIQHVQWGGSVNNVLRIIMGKSDGTEGSSLVLSQHDDGRSTVSFNNSQVFLPAGAVFAFAANSAPAGCLLCNGAEVSRTTYSALFAAIGTTYGTGDGSTTFNLPNLTDKFIQGGGTAGTVKSAGLPELEGQSNSRVGSLMINEQAGVFANSEQVGEYDSGLQSGGAFQGATLGRAYLRFKASLGNAIYGASSTVQPPALTMRYYIKY